MIYFVKPKHTDVDPYVFGSNTLAHAFQPGRGLGGDAHFNELINWDFKVSYNSKPEDGKISFFGVALHELGHSLGLGHTVIENAVMYEFYSSDTSTLAEDDIRGMQHIYGVPPHKKYKPPPKQEDSKEDMPVWGQTPLLPDKCYTAYDAIAMIDDELIAFRRKYMFGPNMNMTEFRSRWKGFSPRTTHVDAVFQTSEKKILFFMNQDVHTFIGNTREKSFKLKDLGIDESVLKIDAIFRKSDNNVVYIFVGNYYYKFDEHKLMVEGSRKRIADSFKDVYDLDTAFTYKDKITYFFKNESFFEFDNNRMRLNRMKPGLSANFFMDCDVPVVSFSSRITDDENDPDKVVDYIDLGSVFEDEKEEVDCNNPERAKPCQKDSANSIKSFSFLVVVLIVTRFFF
ncbi:interstitial collagenase-like [Chironomus tepperi]|uniref:interstitial collagenase-like n=1 Tax=Chironomus tepperi TaxID=113505 RepID=UPI00391F422C